MLFVSLFAWGGGNRPQGGELGALDFRMGGIGAPFNGLKAFATTDQLGIYDKLANALALGTSPIVKALFNFDAAMVSRHFEFLYIHLSPPGLVCIWVPW